VFLIITISQLHNKFLTGQAVNESDCLIEAIGFIEKRGEPLTFSCVQFDCIKKKLIRNFGKF
jgi:hypothetical protein